MLALICIVGFLALCAWIEHHPKDFRVGNDDTTCDHGGPLDDGSEG